MQPHPFDLWISKLMTLPARDQVGAVRIAVQRCEPLAADWFDGQKLGAAFREYLASLDRWLAGQVKNKELEKSARPLDRRLNREIENEQDLPGAMAAHAQTDLMAIGLGYSPEMLDEILTTAVFFAAAAFTGSRDVPIQVDADRLSREELAFIDEWWRECLRRFPNLAA